MPTRIGTIQCGKRTDLQHSAVQFMQPYLTAITPPSLSSRESTSVLDKLLFSLRQHSCVDHEEGERLLCFVRDKIRDLFGTEQIK